MSYLDVQRNATVHEGDIEVDENIIAREARPESVRPIRDPEILIFCPEFPPGTVFKGCCGHGASYWNKTARLDVEIDGQQKSYFLKLTGGPDGGPMLQGEHESMKLIHKIVPEFSPLPLAWGKCKDSDNHFSLFSFHQLKTGDPTIPRFTYAVAQLHSLSPKANPTGKFGFHVTTYNGTLAQDNAWTDTWEEFYTRGMRHMLKLEQAARGPSDDLDHLSGPFLDKVIPRLLRPLETGGRSVKPVLIHGDLWLGNVSIQQGSDDPLMYDSSAFWGHNEYELGIMRPLENDWARDCMASYHQRIAKSEPTEDWDARNALYAIRAIIHDSALWPSAPHFREKLIHEMRKLVNQFSEGYVEGDITNDGQDHFQHTVVP
ncbi:Fructosamine kinase-domain-containing protein [Xylaria sp. FL1777]|nr:Fructosamine kinase-domain-containing protein [Xylaria sp. FL1777]